MLHLVEESSTEYTLSHHEKSMVTERFEPLKKWEIPYCIANQGKMDDRICNMQKRMWDLYGNIAGEMAAIIPEHTADIPRVPPGAPAAGMAQPPPLGQPDGAGGIVVGQMPGQGQGVQNLGAEIGRKRRVQQLSAGRATDALRINPEDEDAYETQEPPPPPQPELYPPTAAAA